MCEVSGCGVCVGSMQSRNKNYQTCKTIATNRYLQNQWSSILRLKQIDKIDITTKYTKNKINTRKEEQNKYKKKRMKNNVQYNQTKKKEGTKGYIQFAQLTMSSFTHPS